MKVNIEIDLTPEEARTFLGLPDLSPIHDAFIEKATSKINTASQAMDVEPLMRSWTTMGGIAQEALATVVGAALKGATTGASATPAKPTASTPRKDSTDKPKS